MANLAITNTFVTGTQALASQVNQNFSDISTYVNARNGGSTAWDFLLAPAASLSAVTNQLVLGTTTTTTVSATAPASSAVYTIPDVGVTGAFILSNSSNQGLFANGTALLPSFAFTSDPDTGICRLGANDIGISAGGATQLELSTTKAIFNGLALFADGSASTPGVSFGADQNTGLYRIGADNIALVTGGTAALTIDASQNITAAAVVNVPNTDLQVGGNQVLPVVQIVQATTTSFTSTSSGTYVDTVLTVAITPKFSSSKVMVTVSGATNTSNCILRLNRGSTALLDPFGPQSSTGPVSVQYYDSPGTTSAVTYKVQVKAGAGTVQFGVSGVNMVITAVEYAQ